MLSQTAPELTLLVIAPTAELFHHCIQNRHRERAMKGNSDIIGREECKYLIGVVPSA